MCILSVELFPFKEGNEMNVGHVARSVVLHLVFVVVNIAIFPLVGAACIFTARFFGEIQTGIYIATGLFVLSAVTNDVLNYYLVTLPVFAIAAIAVIIGFWNPFAGLSGLGVWACFFGARWANPRVMPAET